MLNVYLCDDNTTILEKYEEKIKQIAKKNYIAANTVTFTSGEQLLFHLDNHMNDVDILYLDIMMGGANGIEVAKKLRNADCHAQIIFLTANSEYIFDSFDVTATQYILKDSISDERFTDIFLRAALQSEKNAATVFLCSSQNGSIKKQIPFRSISYFEVSNRIVSVHYGQSTFDFYAKLDTLEQELSGNDFVRVHRSFLVHLPFIDTLHKDCLILINGEKIPLGITYVKEVKRAMHRYMNILQ